MNNRLANLLSMSERGDGRPGSGMYAVFEIMVERLEALLGRLEGVWGEELEAVNGRLGEVGREGSRRVGCGPKHRADREPQNASNTETAP